VRRSKRLEESILLCLLLFEGNKSSLLFFTVSGKETDPGKPASSSSHGFATVTARFAANNENDLNTAFRLNCRNSSGILTEIPGILPATLLLVLESLRDLYRLCRLPFRQWIIPDRLESHIDNSAPLDITPTTYARSRNFKFPLKDIFKYSADDVLVYSTNNQYPGTTLLINLKPVQHLTENNVKPWSRH